MPAQRTRHPRIALEDIRPGMTVRRVDRAGMSATVTRYEVTMTLGRRVAAWQIDRAGERVRKVNLANGYMVHFEQEG